MGDHISRAADTAPRWRAFYAIDLIPLVLAVALVGAAYLPATGASPAAAGIGTVVAVILTVGSARGFGLPHPRLAIGIILVFILLGLLVALFGSLALLALLGGIGVFAVCVAEMFLGDSRRDLLRQLSGSYVILALALAAMLWPFAYATVGGRGGALAAASALMAGSLARLFAGGRLADHRIAAAVLWAIVGVIGGLGGSPWWVAFFGVLLAPAYLIVDELFVVPPAARANVGVQLMPIALGGALACALAALVA